MPGLPRGHNTATIISIAPCGRREWGEVTAHLQDEEAAGPKYGIRGLAIHTKNAPVRIKAIPSIFASQAMEKCAN